MVKPIYSKDAAKYDGVGRDLGKSVFYDITGWSLENGEKFKSDLITKDGIPIETEMRGTVFKNGFFCFEEVNVPGRKYHYKGQFGYYIVFQENVYDVCAISRFSDIFNSRLEENPNWKCKKGEFFYKVDKKLWKIFHRQDEVNQYKWQEIYKSNWIF